MPNMDYTKYAKIGGEAPVEPVVEAPVESVSEEIVEPEPIFVTGTTVEPITEPEEPESEPEGPQRKTGRVFGCAKLNVRKEPKPGADIVCEIHCHTEVEIDEDESTEDFYKVYTTSGIEGFCMKSYILEK